MSRAHVNRVLPGRRDGLHAQDSRRLDSRPALMIFLWLMQTTAWHQDKTPFARAVMTSYTLVLQASPSPSPSQSHSHSHTGGEHPGAHTAAVPLSSQHPYVPGLAGAGLQSSSFSPSPYSSQPFGGLQSSVPAQQPVSIPVGRVELVKSAPDGYFSLNILLTTILFIVIFMTGTAWTQAATDIVRNNKNSWKMAVFAAVSTVLAFGLSVGFAELHRANKNINVNVQGLFAA